MKYLAAFPILLLVACSSQPDGFDAPVTCPGDGDYPFADVLVDQGDSSDTISGVDKPENAVNGVRGEKGGSKDVYSRGYDADNNSVILAWSHRRVLNVDGPDFVVFENAFEFSAGVFMDLIVVSVSIDGESWETFRYDYVAEDETQYIPDAALWEGFAGRTPVTYSSDDEACPDPFEGGGDAFDLDSLPATSLGDTIREDGFVFLKLTSAPSFANPDTGEAFVADPISDGFDLDGVYARETEP